MANIMYFMKESGELTKDREESKVNTTREEHTINTVRVEPTVNTAYQHNAFGEENYGGKIEGDSEEKNDGCIQENSETGKNTQKMIECFS